jgi:hypothetical protein
MKYVGLQSQIWKNNFIIGCSVNFISGSDLHPGLVVSILRIGTAGATIILYKRIISPLYPMDFDSYYGMVPDCILLAFIDDQESYRIGAA